MNIINIIICSHCSVSSDYTLVTQPVDKYRICCVNGSLVCMSRHPGTNLLVAVGIHFLLLLPGRKHRGGCEVEQPLLRPGRFDHHRRTTDEPQQHGHQESQRSAH